MKAINLVGILGVIAAVTIWAVILKGPRQPPFAIATMAGCYISTGADNKQKVNISAAGRFVHGAKSTRVSAYEDKEGLSLLPEMEVVATANGDLAFVNGQPFILKIDVDKRGFVVPSVIGAWLPFRRVGC